ncbi:TPA: tellurium resistance protein TerZ, partial [Klebsiella pneumoniae]|nr:tellurium resistance protein TerZ [Klebsiella pneumoniae]HBX1422982.1 tellurium resistance protein TerZ [Klebsiella pneumoniae]HBX1446811.1 tellurium resistance protein TerZ [Klebsiella pneumoniae]HBX1452789.1 tellurium resistance protein TerZ [Klebsiella pneumoniae]HBX1506030.1 tellurium resistance protein TerZ [Klebsiella pneumoniae]
KASGGRTIDDMQFDIVSTVVKA